MSEAFSGRVAKLSWIVASGPIALLTAVVLHALSVRLYLDRWPVVYRDNPEALILRAIEYGMILPALYCSLFGVPLWLVTAIPLGAMGYSRWRSLRQLALIAAGVVGVILVVKFDPTGYVEWFLD